MNVTRSRINIHRSWILVLACLFTSLAVAEENEVTISESQQRQKVSQQSRTLFQNKKWDELEVLASEYLTQKARFPGGRWKLDWFYRGLQFPPNLTSAPKGWDGHLTALQEWKAAATNSATPLTALGIAYIDYAFAARGGDYAQSVAQEGWRLFRERLSKAQEALEAAEKMPNKDPETYNRLLRLARAQGWPRIQFEEMFRKAIQFEPDYHQIYFTKAYYLMPRWHGKPGDVEQFAEEAIVLSPEKEAIYSRIALDQSSFVKRDDFSKEYHFSWPRIRQGFQTMQKQYPKSLYNIDSFCLLACLMGDRATAGQLFAQIGDKWSDLLWGDEGYHLHWKKWAESDVK